MSTVIIGGFNLGGSTEHVDDNGCSWITEPPLTGWGNSDTTFSITQKERADGGWPGPSYKKPRTVAGVSSVVGPSTAAVAASLDEFYAACEGEVVLSVDDGQGPRWAMAQRQYGAIPTWTSDVACDVSWQMEVADSRKLGTPMTGSTGLPSATGGLTVPFTVPFTIASTIVSGNVVLTNPGKGATGPVTARITGPVTAPMITHVGSGLSLVFNTNLVLGAGEYLDIDMDNRKALAQGQATRAQYITARGWSGFDPGGNVWAFSAVSGGPGARLDITATPAWP